MHKEEKGDNQKGGVVKTLLIILLLVLPCFAEEGILDKAYRDVQEQSQSIRKRNADYFRWQEEFDRRERQLDEQFDNESDYEYKYESDTGRQYWETEEGLMIEGGNYGGE
jgi:hypothetical protein